MRMRFSACFLAIAAVCWLAPSAFAQSQPSRAKLGEKMPNLTFKDEKGKTYRLYELENKKAIAIVFVSFECPVSNSYMAPLSEIADEFGKAGVTVWGLTTGDETPAQIAKSATEF